DRVADKDVPVTISGESGTGKELIARALHAASSRRGPFVPLNCGAIPEALLESELFGHERGAFTGAVRAKPGLFEIARGGTLFLDEIGDMPLGMQVKLLRVLQTREFRRVGGTVDLASDARVVSATNRNLEELVRKGAFREDLWYRLNVVEMHLPPLRERRDDLPLLIDHLLTSHARGVDVRLSKRALALLLDYAWPGNVRELDNELQRAIALADGVIEPDVLSSKVAGRATADPGEEPADGTLKRSIDRHERDVIRATLAEHGGRVAAAARALGLTRAGLYKKMHKLGLAAPDRD
ncbi:MAG TPA: sigma 54-interacting transcriptional regulator, partial [Myxococcota bacterium]|nr:sigma 54-interacting transcriptional regulator [Myxococcota bacterium]